MTNVDVAFDSIRKNMQVVEKAIEEAISKMEQNNGEISCFDGEPIYSNVIHLLGILGEKLPNKVSIIEKKILHAINLISQENPGFSFDRIKNELEYINSIKPDMQTVSFEDFLELYAKYLVIEVFVTGSIQCR